MPDSPKLFDQIRITFRLKHYSPKTEKSYLYYIKDFLQYHGMRPPHQLRVQEIREYLSHLAVDKHICLTEHSVDNQDGFCACTAENIVPFHTID